MQIIAARFTIINSFILLNLYRLLIRVLGILVALTQRACISAIPLAPVPAASPQQRWFCRSLGTLDPGCRCSWFGLV